MASQNPTVDAFLKTLKEHQSAKDYDQMLATAQEAVGLFPTESKLWDSLHYAQAHYVNSKLESDVVKQLIEKKDYNALANVYQKLLTIFPESSQLTKLLKSVRQKIQEGQHSEVQNYYSAAQKQIETLMQQNNFEEAVAACHEILDSEPENKTFIRLLARAEKGLDHQMNQALELYFKDALPALNKEYKENQDQFIAL